jgi:predicted Ser/Thr protein kinase
MGVVYEGFDPVIGRTVAIKTMLTSALPPAEFEDFKARFQREAQAAGMLNHPNIVTVYDFGEDDGVLYLAMEFLEGKSLEDMVKEEGAIPVERIIPIIEQVCAALDHAHSFKIIHRDVKPANIMVLRSGRVKMTDFGIAKMMSMGMTQAGQILGTPNYMSPEQVRGRQIDGRSDLFSLGIILYELITKEKPFGGQNLTTIIYRIINENPIPPRELDATIHPGLSYVIQKALAKDPDERYQTCHELAEDLKNYRNLGDAVAPSATVVTRVPPIGQPMPGPTRATTPAPPARQVPVPPRPMPRAAPPPPAAPEFAEQPIPRAAPQITVIPPAQVATPKGSMVPWVLFFIVLAAGLAGAYYVMVLQPKQAAQNMVVQPAAQPPPAAVTPPVTPDPNAVPAPADSTSPVPAPGTVTGDTNPATTPAAPPVEPASPPKPAAGTPPTHTEPKPAPGSNRPSGHPTGSLAVSSNIPGAQITVDGKTDPSWVTPYTIPDLSPGNHSIVIVKEGFSVIQRNIVIDPGNPSTLSVDLSAPSGEINIVTTPPGIDVLIDGQPAGKTPLQKAAKVGKHTYTLQAPGMDPYSSTFEIRSDGSVVTKRIDLSGAVSASTGSVDVRTVPPGASVSSGGKPIGGPTPASIRLAPGRYMLSLSLEGYQTLHVGVEVPADGTVTINERLKPQ